MWLLDSRMQSESDCLTKGCLVSLFIGGSEFVTVEVFMLCDLKMFLIFSFLISFIMSLDVRDQVSTAIREHNII